MEESVAFERSKIYEKLDYQPEPKDYTGNLPWIVQQQIAATNGEQYIDRIGKLNDYPEYELPVEKVASGIMLDIGNGWGRWLVAGSRKGYIPVGADIRLEFCKTARETMKAKGVYGYTVVADLQDLPFRNNVFDLVWSFSVIQHTHKKRLIKCLGHIRRILKGNGFTKLEFPNKNGIHNYFGPYKKSLKTADDFESWDVRYYSINEYRKMLKEQFGNFSYSVHSMLGIGVLKEDLKYVSLKNKILCAASLAGSFIAKVIPPMGNICDSIYVKSVKAAEPANEDALRQFMSAHSKDPSDNLNIVSLLHCPLSQQALTLSADKNFLLTADGKLKYPVVEGIPVMIASEAIKC